MHFSPSRRSLLTSVLALAAAAAGPARGAAQVPEPPKALISNVRTVDVTARPIATFARSGGGPKFGKLEYRGGLVLTSAAQAFGGFSGIVVEPDGKRFVMVSDEGAWLSGEIGYSGTAPAGVRNARMGPYSGTGGRPLDKKRDLDAEAVALLDGTLGRGTLLIGFERNHRIGRFPVVDGVVQSPTGYLKLPPEAKRMRSNKGFEVVAVMQGGPYKGSPIAFSERFPDNPALHTGWLWDKGEPKRLTLPDIGEFELTDGASLADGTLIFLERRFKWTEGVKMRLRRFPADQVKPGAVMQGEVLLEGDMSYEIDNMEGLAVHRGPSGETVLTLISDDNYNSFLQRTILLQFTLLEGGEATARR